MSMIVKWVCGMTIESLGGKDDIFIEKAKKLFSPPETKSPAIMMAFILPDRLFSWLVNLLFNFDDWNFFIDVMKNVVNQRSESPRRYHDFLEFVTESISTYTKEINGKKVLMWTKDQVEEIVAAMETNFILAGYDTVASALAASCFMLARHPEIQDRIHNLIMDKIDQYVLP